MQLAKSMLYSCSRVRAVSSSMLQSSTVGTKSNDSGLTCVRLTFGAPSASRYFFAPEPYSSDSDQVQYQSSLADGCAYQGTSVPGLPLPG
jgi:hypothetical protein